MGDLLELSPCGGRTYLINSVEIGNAELDTGGYKNYIWSYNRKQTRGAGVLRAVFLVAPDKEAADRLFIHTLYQRTRKEHIHNYDGDTWYVRKEGPSFYDDEPVLNACWT